MIKVSNNNNKRIVSLASLNILHIFSRVSIVAFEQVNVSWAVKAKFQKLKDEIKSINKTALK